MCLCFPIHCWYCARVSIKSRGGYHEWNTTLDRNEVVMVYLNNLHKDCYTLRLMPIHITLFYSYIYCFVTSYEFSNKSMKTFYFSNRFVHNTEVWIMIISTLLHSEGFSCSSGLCKEGRECCGRDFFATKPRAHYWISHAPLTLFNETLGWKYSAGSSKFATEQWIRCRSW
jgi:hypothetical protein